MSTTEAVKPADSRPKVTTKARWLKKGHHTITLYSAETIEIAIPNLAMLIRIGLVPLRLRAMAMRAARGEEMLPPAKDEKSEDVSDEEWGELQKMVELLDFLIMQMVLNPKLSQEDVDAIPTEDRELLIAIAQRERDTDAVGRRLGVEPLYRWETFRSEHGCAPDCPECQKCVQAHSSVDVGDL